MKDRLGSQEQQEPETAFVLVPPKVCLSPFLHPTSVLPPQRPQQHGLCTSGTPLLASLKDAAPSPRALMEGFFLFSGHALKSCAAACCLDVSLGSPLCVQVLLGVFFTSGRSQLAPEGGKQMRDWGRG